MARQSHQLRPHKHLQHLRSRKHWHQLTDQNQQSPQPKLLRNTHWRTQFRPKSVKIIQQIRRIILTLFFLFCFNISLYLHNIKKCMKLFNNVIQDPMNIAYGIGLAIIIAGILLFVIITVKGNNKITPFCYLTTIILTPLLDRKSVV